MADIPETAPTNTNKLLRVLFKCSTWLLAAGCFYLAYRKLDMAAASEGITALTYLVRFFGNADWLIWLATMIPYSIFFFCVDAHVTWRTIRWFNVPTIKLKDVLPIRASAYILSLVNEQAGKGAMVLYLLKRHEVPGWQALSTMIFLAMLETCQLLMFASVGMFLYFEDVVAASKILRLDLILPAVFMVAAVYLPIHIAYFRGHLFPKLKLRNVPVLRSFREAKIQHYVLTVLFKAPNLIGAVFVYTIALNLFQVEANTGQLLAILPLIFLATALPLPFHAGALLLWTVLFPDYPEVGAFSLVMHTFFVLFNAAIGILFLPKANKELFEEKHSKSDVAS